MSNEARKDRLWRLERENFQLRTLFEVAQALSDCRESRGIFYEVLSILAGTFGVEKAFALSQREDGRWYCISARGDRNAEQVSALLQSSANTKLDSILPEIIKTFGAAQDTSHFAIADFHIDEKTSGAFVLGPRLLGEPYNEADRELVKAVASFSARAIENLQLYENLREAQEKLKLENLSLREAVKKEYGDSAILGKSNAIQHVLQQVRNFGKSDANVLIIGETGTGKELVARALHYHSKRADGPFLGINCTAIPENLVETEFFGIEAGTATGVNKRIGLFEQAHGGTLFIDEIGDMPLSSQAKLLRVLQERSLRRVGGDHEIPVDVRIVSATNKKLYDEIAAERFREDLYYRIAVLEIQIPALQARTEDISILANHFLSRFENRLQKKTGGFAPELLQSMEDYSWPGNVRELENEIERMVTLAEEGQRLIPQHLAPKFRRHQARTRASHPAPSNLRDAVDRLEREMIAEALERFDGNKSRVARTLGLSRLGLQHKMDRLGVQYTK